VYNHVYKFICEIKMEFVHPSTWLISGPTGCGKTQFILRLLCGNQITPAPTRVIWVYAEWQDAYLELVNKFGPAVQFMQAFTEEDYKSLMPTDNNVVVLDDQMIEGGAKAGSKDGVAKDTLVRLFVQGSHHRSITIIYPVQNLFDKQKSHRTISVNAQYMVIFRNPRDSGQIEYLGRQLAPRDKGFLTHAFQDATSLPYRYLFLNFRQETPSYLKVMTNVLDTGTKDEDNYLEVYIPKSEERNIPDTMRHGSANPYQVLPYIKPREAN
jgi:energy-coupling factor transporter ATP-binding protein EcfA2